MKRLGIILCGLPLITVANTTVYQSKGESGEKVFSSKASMHAKGLELPDVQTFSATTTAAQLLTESQITNTEQSEPRQQATAEGFYQLAIVNPDPIIYRTQNANVMISANVSPALQQGDRLLLQVKNPSQVVITKSRLGPSKNQQIDFLVNPSAGEQYIFLEIINRNNKVIASTIEKKVYIRMHKPRRSK